MLEDLTGDKTKFVIERKNIPGMLRIGIFLNEVQIYIKKIRKSSLRATKENLNKWREIPLSQIEVFDIIDKLIYKLTH